MAADRTTVWEEIDVIGATGLEVDVAVPVPTGLVAATTIEYRPAGAALKLDDGIVREAADADAVADPGEVPGTGTNTPLEFVSTCCHVTLKPVRLSPPLSRGGDHETSMAPAPSGVAVTLTKAPGTYAAEGVPEPVAAVDEPAALSALSETV